MGKILRDEDLRLNIIVNGDPARRKIGDLTREVRDLSNENRVLRKEQSLLRATGQQNTAQYKALTKQIKENLAIIKRNKAQLDSMRGSMAINCMTMDDLSRRATSLRIALRNTVPGTAAWQELANQLKTVTRRQEELKLMSKETGLTLGNIANGINRYIGLITAGFASLTLVKQIVSKVRGEYLQYDEALTRASRTTNLTKEEVRALSDELATLDTRTAQNELIELIGLAGKLGLSGEEDILGFVTAADKINVALSEDLGGNAEDALREIGKLVDIFKLKGEYGMEESMLKIGSTINSLGMASTANEGYIVDFAKQVAGMSQTVGMTAPQVLGLGATLDSLGQRGETAATALTNVIADISKNAEQYAKVAGVSLQEFTQLLETDVNEALLLVLEGIGQGSSADTIKLLDSLGLSGSRATTILGSLSQNVDTIRKQQELANQAFLDATSIKEEFNRMNSSATAIMEKAKKDVIEEARLLGEQLNPMITTSLSLTSHGIRLLSSIIGFAVKYKAVIMGLSIAIGAYNLAKKAQIALEKLTEFYSKRNMVLLRQRARDLATVQAAEMAVSKSSALLCAVQNLLVFNLKAAGTAFKTFFASMGPIGWATLAIGTLVTAYQAWKQSADDTSEAVDTMGRINKRVAEETASERAEIESLSNIIHDNTRSIGARMAAIEDLRRIIPEYHGSLTKEGELINDNTSAINDYCSALRKQIRLQAVKDELSELYKQEDIAEQNVDSAREARANYRGNIYEEKSLFEEIFGVNLVEGDYSKLNKAYNEAVRKRDEIREDIAELEKEYQIRYEEYHSGSNGGDGGDGGDGSDGSEDFNNDPKDGSWSLGSDTSFLRKRLALKNQFLSGEIATEEAYNAQLLDLEIATLQKRLDANIDSADDRLALQEQLADKLLEKQQTATKEQERQAKEQQQQSEQALREQEELAMEIARMSDDRVAIENANYEKLKRKYAGNAKALEALERAHQARLNKIKLDEFDDDTEKRQAQYQVERRMMESRHRQELESFKGSQRGLRELRKKQWKELNDLDEQYLTEMIAQLSNLVNNGKIGDIEIGVALSDEDKLKLLKQIEDLREQLEKLKGTDGDTAASESFDGSFLGLGGDEWKNLLEGNLEDWEDWANAVADITEALGDQVMGLWSSVDKFMSAKENSQLKLFEKNNDKKKKALEKRLNAGRITEAQYKSEVEAMDAEYDAYQEELQLKQAKRQKAMSITESVINTAVGVTKSLTGLPWPINLIAAAATLAMGVAQTALIAATPITTGAEEGGPIGGGDPISVRRAQDGKPFRARLNPGKRGFVSTPTVIVAENGTEYVMPNEALQNPTVYPLLSAMETARRNGTLDTLDFSAIYSPYSVVGRAIGGYIGQSGNASSISPSGGTPADIAFLYKMLEKVLTRLDEPLNAQVVMLGKNGFVEKWEQYQKQRQRGKLG